MLRILLTLMALPLLMVSFSMIPAAAQDLQEQYEPDEQLSQEYYDRTRIDRYLNVEIWTDHDNDEFYEGDRVKFYFRVSRDAFVAIYGIDTKGRVNLLFPGTPNRDNYVTGGATHSFPGRNDDYDLVVSGPEGVENVQIIASREPFPIPDWYNNSGLFCDWEDRHAYMDWVNSQYFVKYEGQRFAYDRTSLYVYEWEPNYFRPVYRPYYPHWTVSGNVYVDYWPGSSIYIDGIFWGITPCYIPRIYVGWHTFSIYDRYNYFWEYDVHVTRYNTVVLDYTVINTQPNVRSKYKSVRFAGYQEPVKAGYKDYNQKVKVIEKSGVWKTETTSKIIVDNKEVEKGKTVYTGQRKFVKGSSEVIKTERGIETAGASLKTKTDFGNNKRTIGTSSMEKGSVIGTDNGKSGRTSIFKRRDSNVQSDRSVGTSTSNSKGSVIKRKESPAAKRNVGNSSSGTSKKPSSSTVNKKAPSTPAPSKPANNDGASKVKKDPPKQSSGSASAPKRIGGSSGSSAGQKSGSSKPAATPKSGKSGSGKGKGGGNN